jgi:sortase A
MKLRKRMEAVLWATGLSCAGYLLLVVAQAQVFHHRAAHLAVSESIPPQTPPFGSPSGSLIGRVEIPKLQLSVPVLEDDESVSLLRGLGHIRGTANLGGLGTVGLAGHRDTFLRSLRGIANGMEILASDTSGTYHYVVDSTEIVVPEQVSVLDTQSRPALTMITCYPFDYVGHAPKRFIVHAHLVSVSPDASSQ